MNKASESIQFSLIALIFAATTASLRHTMLQAPLFQSVPHETQAFLLQNMELEINSRVSTESKNELEETQTVTKSFVEYMETKIARDVSKVVPQRQLQELKILFLYIKSSLKREAGTMKCLFCFFVQMLQLQKKEKTFLEAADELKHRNQIRCSPDLLMTEIPLRAKGVH